MKATQCDRIIDYIKERGSITQLEALREIGCFRLASRMCDIKKQGYQVKSEMTKVKNRYGEDVSIAKYTIDWGENSADNGM
jgi:hypothetical protein